MLLKTIRRVEQLEEVYWRRTLDATDRYLEGRSVEDVEFFCVHGYLPEVPTPGIPYIPERLSWKQRWKQWKEHKLTCTNKSVEEREFFCVHGYWPAQAKDDNDGNN